MIEVLSFIILSFLLITSVFIMTRVGLYVPTNIIGAYILWWLFGYVFYLVYKIPFGTFLHLDDLYISMIPSTSIKILFFMLILSIGSIFFFYIHSILPKNLNQSAKSNNLYDVTYQGIENLKTNSNFNILLIISSFIVINLAIITLISGVGFKTIFFYQEYLISERPFLKISGTILAPISAYLSGYSYSSASKKIAIKFFILFFIFLLIIVLLAIGSRRAALIPPLFFLGFYSSSKEIKNLKTTIFIILILSFTFYIIALVSRVMPDKGIIPLFSFFVTASEYELPYDTTLFVYILNTIANSIPLATYTAMAEKIPESYFFISINPLPGFMVGWYEIFEGLRVNKFIPYNSVGELLNHGNFFGAIYYFFIGIFLSFVQLTINAAKKRNYYLVILILQALVFLFFIFSIQYNLRSSTRYIYYAVFFCFLFYFQKGIFRKNN